MSPVNCACADNVVTLPIVNEYSYLYQCNSCPSPTTTTSYLGDPRNGRLCYVQVLSLTPIPISLNARAYANYVFQPGQISSGIFRLVVDVWSGDVRVIMTTTGSLVFQSGTVNPIIAEDSLLYEPVELSIYAKSTTLAVNYVVFFFVFFVSFFLILGITITLFQVRLLHRQYTVRRREVLEMTALAERPMASMTLLMDPHMHSMHHVRSLDGVYPIASQQTADKHAMLVSHIVLLPNNQASSSSRLHVGTALVHGGVTRRPAAQRIRRIHPI